MSVASPRKVAANRANALASTGPKTAAGKARSARNAMRHGLCGEGWADPAISRAIERVGRRLAGEAAGQERELAYAVAAAQVDLARAREAGRRICAQAPIAAALARSLFPPGTPAAVAPDEDPEQLEELLCDAVYQLEAIKRYERRAFARRERAIRVLDDRRTGAEPPPRRLARPRGLRLPRWRLPNPDARVIRFEGLPRWAWWRPDPLDAPPKTRRAPRRKRQTEGPGELELLVSSALLARPRPGASDVGESRDASNETGRPIREGHDLTPLPACSANDQLPDARLTATDPATASLQPDAAGFPCSPTLLGGEGIIEKWSETKPPQTAAGQSGQAPPASDSSAPASPGTTLTQHQSETKPWLRVSRPTPLPTCRAGPCRWVGEMPADHWSYRGWRYRRPPAHAAGFGAPPQIDPLVQRCPGSPRGRSRAPP